MSSGSTTSPVFDYTSLDYESCRADLFTYGAQNFSSIWTDQNESDFEVVLVENLAYVTDLVSYSANAWVLEGNPLLAIREQNVRNWCKVLGYSWKELERSTTTLRLFDLPNPSDGAYTFPISKHQQFGTPEGIIFQPIVDITVDSGTNVSYDADDHYYIDFDVQQGVEHYHEVLGSSDASPNQSFLLTSTPLLPNTLSIVVAGYLYEQVTYLSEYGPTDKVYTLNTDEDNNVYILFGDGINGAIPPIAQVFADFFEGSLVDANVDPEYVTEILGTADGSAVDSILRSASVKNTVKATGWSPKESIVSAKKHIPLVQKANDRAVTEEDYGGLTESLVSGVFRARSIPGRAVSGQVPPVIVTVPNGFGEPSNTLRAQILNALRSKKMAGKRPKIIPATYATLKMAIEVHVQPRYSATKAASTVHDIALAQFGSDNADFVDEVLSLQEAYDLFDPKVVPGIRRVFFREFTIEPYFARFFETPTTGDGEVTHITTTQAAKQRTWVITIATPIPGLSCYCYMVQECIEGVVNELVDTAIVDEKAAFTTNELSDGGYSLILNPFFNGYASATGEAVISNTENEITVASGLLSVGQPDDEYVLVRDTHKGKILQTFAPSNVSNSTTIPVDSVLNWDVGDKLTIVDGSNVYYRTITAIGVSDFTVDLAITIAINSTIYHRWVSDDESVEFTVKQGTIPWVIGDYLYVATFPKTGDLSVKKNVFLLCETGDITTTTVGGIK